MPDKCKHGQIVKLRCIADKCINSTMNGMNQDLRIKRRRGIEDMRCALEPEQLIVAIRRFRKAVCIEKENRTG